MLDVGIKTIRGGVYWFDPETVKGSELRKVRPCIVVSPDELNQNLATVIIVPLTSTLKGWPCRYTVDVLGQQSSAACEQIRVVDKSRLRQHIGVLKPADLKALLALLQTIFA